MKYKAIKDQLVTVLNTVTSLNAVYGKDAKELDNVPAACVFAKGHGSEFHTVGSGGANNTTYEHYIMVYFPTDEKDDADYEDVLTTTADDVLTALTHAGGATIAGVWDYALPISGNWRFGDKEVNERVFEIVFQSTVHLTR
jgi:hypothetical protein